MIELAHVVKRYRSVTAVDGVSLRAGPGKVTALLGPNGAGKTSLLRMVVGITRPDEGDLSVRIDGRRAAANDIGYLPEERGLFKGVTVRRTLGFFGRLQGMSSADADAAVMRWLDRLGLADRADDKIDTLSRGNQQKVQLVAALLHSPAIAVLDEPFSGLDPINQNVFIELIHELRDSGVIVLMSAHEMSLVERTADDVVLVRQGKVALAGSIDDLTARGPLHDVYVAAVGEAAA